MAKNQANRPEQNKQTQNDEQFPGYPHYPKTEDIMDSRSDAERVNINVESLPNFHNATTPHRLNAVEGSSERETSSSPTDDLDSDLGIEMGTEADVTPEERKMLEDDMYYPTQDEDNLRHARLDDTDNDGEPLNEESFGVGQTESGSDLDVDNDLDATSTDAMDQGDEENQYYSLGGDEKEDSLEGKHD